MTLSCAWPLSLAPRLMGQGAMARIIGFVAGVVSFLRSLVRFFYTDGLMYLSGKAYKPTDPSVVEQLIRELQPLVSKRTCGWTFVDLGCGQGGLLPIMRTATMPSGSPMFQHVVGVELDPDTHRQALKRVAGDSSIEVVCGDMFEYVRTVCAKSPLLGGRAVFYMYEPLWAANMPKPVRDGLYNELLAAVGAHADSIVVYITGVVQMHERHIEQTMLERAGLTLQHQQCVAQSGAANKLSATYNTMEIWRAGGGEGESGGRAVSGG